MLNPTSNHSKIVDYPIDTDLYPLAKDVIFHEYTLTPNQYLYIPVSWLHWIFTDPYTVSFHYVFKENVSYPDQDESDLFVEDIRSKQPFVGESFNFTPQSFPLDDFFKKNQHESFHATYSITSDVSPVQKIPSNPKIHTYEPLSFIMKKSSSYYSYAGRNNVNSSNPFFIPYLNVNRVIHSSHTIECLPTLWFSLDKKVQSGLHIDNISTLVYVMSGKKRVLLAEPMYQSKSYLF